MYFKQIELTGFKSFADRTVINLESGMTAIVGPNGCGKSNILDAMRWALGEQRPTILRGAHMQDVIFNGSEERAPMGMAEVTLTFENSDGALPIDFTEVQITRRVYRAGESEYLINKAPCRLRDIQELFMDTGIGTHAYSMIGQGKIGMVLSSKPEDRRFLFEEAAGIIKYKARKRIAMRKLEHAEQNQLRLGDIIAELERQMRSLKRQVNAAARYRELTAELRELEIRASWFKHRQLSRVIDKQREQFAEAQGFYESANDDVNRMEARQEELNLAKLEIDRVLHARREEVYQIDSDIEKIEKQIALIRQQIAFSDEQAVKADDQRAAIERQAHEAAEQLQATRSESRTLEEQRAELRQTLESKQLEHDTAMARLREAETDLESIRHRAVEVMGMRVKAQSALDGLDATLRETAEQLVTLVERERSVQRRHDELMEKIESVRRDERDRRHTVQELEDRGRETAERLRATAAELDALDRERQGLRETKSSVAARLASLREIRDAYEGYAAGVRAVMEAARDETTGVYGVIGPVGSLIGTDQEYERAIEAALGGRVNHVIVEHAESAKRAIEYLKTNAAGRLTFLPLDTIRTGTSYIPDYLLREPGVIGPAYDRVRTEERLAPVVRHLLRDVLLVETIDHALNIAKSRPGHPRLVTLEGEVVDPSGAVTGGRNRHEGRGLVGRNTAIDELEAEVARLDSEMGDLTERIDATGAALERTQAESTEIAASETRLRDELGEQTLKLTQLDTELANMAAELQKMAEEQRGLNDRRNRLEAERREVLSQADSVESADRAQQQEIAEGQNRAETARENVQALANELSDLRVNVANSTRSLEEVEREILRREREIDALKGEARREAAAAEEFRQNRMRLENDVKQQVERSAAMSESKEETRQKVAEAENQRQSLLEESEDLDKSLKTAREHVRELQGNVHRLEIDLRHNEDQRAFFEERIREDYHVALGSLREEEVGSDDMDDESRDRAVKEIRQRLERMGSVNLVAIEEYEALTERHEFLTGQQEDLRKARETLMSVVERIDNTIREMFVETFQSVADNFHQYFRRVFNGGQARIYLVDENDPLESGIEIEARPPGKKPQTISLLSGGEQAMTAIALLFSIFRAKPSAFCVLDEVDAPLDDANIGRFVGLIDEFSADTQFVIITHNKQTMARANVLYGVTQQERGVSQLVSVRLEAGSAA